MHWLGYDVGIVERNIFVVTVQVEINTPNYSFLRPLHKTCFVIALTARIVSFAI
jgi:hypothetical protein